MGKADESEIGVSQSTFQAYKDLVDQRFRSMETAVTKAESSTEKRFESVNEFRAALSDAQKFNIGRPEFQAELNRLGDQIATLRDSSKRGEGFSAGVIMAIGLVCAVVGIIAGHMWK